MGEAAIGVNERPADSLQEQAEPGARDEYGRFQPGQSGNPRGRAVGSRNRASLMAENLLAGQAEEIVRRAIGAALEGDVLALRLCVDRLVAPRRLERVRFALPALAKPEDAAKALAAIAAAVASGDLAPAEAGHLTVLVQGFLRAVEAQEFERRLSALEADAARRAHG